MLPSFLVPEAVVREDGQGPGIGLDSSQGKLLLLTLGSRASSSRKAWMFLSGMPDNVNWGDKPWRVFLRSSTAARISWWWT